MKLESMSPALLHENVFEAKLKIELEVGRYLIKTISSASELEQAFALRYQVFQVEMIGSQSQVGLDHDAFDSLSDHLAIYDRKTKQMIATCRLNCSLFSDTFYSETEFDFASLLNRPETKLEIGRVCVHSAFRRGIVLILLWRAIAEYMTKTGSKILFGCGSVMTESPREAHLIYQYLKEEGKVRDDFRVKPIGKFVNPEFAQMNLAPALPLSLPERLMAKSLLPSLCNSYFEIGCYVPGPPAFDSKFRCIDFLTVLESDELDSRVRRKLLDVTS